MKQSFFHNHVNLELFFFEIFYVNTMQDFFPPVAKQEMGGGKER